MIAVETQQTESNTLLKGLQMGEQNQPIIRVMLGPINSQKILKSDGITTYWE